MLKPRDTNVILEITVSFQRLPAGTRSGCERRHGHGHGETVGFGPSRPGPSHARRVAYSRPRPSQSGKWALKLLFIGVSLLFAQDL